MADAFSFVGAIELLKNLGMFDVILPVLLVYAITFGILQRAKIFEKGKGDKQEANKELNASIALVIALLFVSAANMTGIIQKFMPFVGLISVLSITFLMLVGLIGGNLTDLLADGNFGKPLKGVLILLTSIAFLFTFGLAAGWWTLTSASGLLLSGQGIFTTQNVSVLIFIAILVIAIFWITKSTNAKEDKK